MTENASDSAVRCNECLAIALEQCKPVYIQPSCTNCIGKSQNDAIPITDTHELSIQPSPDTSTLETIPEADETDKCSSFKVMHNYQTILLNYEAELYKQEKNYTCQIHKIEESLQELSVNERKQVEKLDEARNERIKQLEQHYDNLKVRIEASIRQRERQLKTITENMKEYLFKLQAKIEEFNKSHDEIASNDFEKQEDIKRKHKEFESQIIEVLIPDFVIKIERSSNLDLDDSVTITAPAPTLVTRISTTVETNNKPGDHQENELNRNIGDSLNAVSDKLWKRHKLTSIPGWPYCLRLIHGQLWQCHRGGITIFDDHLIEQRSITSDELGEVYDVTALSNGEIVVATDVGVYHITVNGKRLYEIAKGTFTGVAESKNNVYAVNRHSGVVQVYQASESWILSHSYKLQCKTGYFITISIHKDLLYAALSEDSTIVAYSLTGELASIYGSAGAEDLGKLDWPYLCYTDEEGAALVADYYNERLQVLSVGGQWSAVNMQPAVIAPRSALLFRDKLFITSWDDKKLSLYG